VADYREVLAGLVKLVAPSVDKKMRRKYVNLPKSHNPFTPYVVNDKSTGNM
jgi:hypothetical protein